MECPLVGNSNGIWGKDKLTVPGDCCVLPLAVTTMNLGATLSMLSTGALAAKYMLVVSESTMTVALFWSAQLRSLLVQLAVNYRCLVRVKAEMLCLGWYYS